MANKNLYNKFLKEELERRKKYKYKCPRCLAGVNVSPMSKYFKCGNCGNGN